MCAGLAGLAGVDAKTGHGSQRKALQHSTSWTMSLPGVAPSSACARSLSASRGSPHWPGARTTAVCLRCSMPARYISLRRRSGTVSRPPCLKARPAMVHVGGTGGLARALRAVGTGGPARPPGTTFGSSLRAGPMRPVPTAAAGHRSGRWRQRAWRSGPGRDGRQASPQSLT